MRSNLRFAGCNSEIKPVRNFLFAPAGEAVKTGAISVITTGP
jgi:hypothetical protein